MHIAYFHEYDFCFCFSSASAVCFPIYARHILKSFLLLVVCTVEHTFFRRHHRHILCHSPSVLRSYCSFCCGHNVAFLHTPPASSKSLAHLKLQTYFLLLYKLWAHNTLHSFYPHVQTHYRNYYAFHLPWDKAKWKWPRKMQIDNVNPSVGPYSINSQILVALSKFYVHIFLSDVLRKCTYSTCTHCMLYQANMN